ncbi:Mitochondrial ribonuclease P protein 1 [Armadillidium nasatum]|uniref:Mitochondrial ribonuclease P protein 1 n=1 Tax=Armadillidium nasatum TaxID=96803 RepID=A0A5N5THB9_9CRUS|nr:Mitochondrial ribonuclease P protein 1 [Armadillidium nasatum]
MLREFLTAISYNTKFLVPLNMKRKYFNITWFHFKTKFLVNENYLTTYYYYCQEVSKNKMSPGKRQRKIRQEKKKLAKWIEMLRYLGENVPEKLSEQQLERLYEIKDEFERKKFLDFMVIKEEQMRLSKELEEKKTFIPHGHIEYSPLQNSMFPSINPDELESVYESKFANAIKFNQPLLIDMNYYRHMKPTQVFEVAKQLQECILDNISHPEPFNLILCNVDFDSKKFHKFSQGSMSYIMKPHYPIIISSKSYLDLFPREKLIYVFPYSKEDMDEMNLFDYEATYMFGGIADHGLYGSEASKRAKTNKIKMLKLPLGRNAELRHIIKTLLIMKEQENRRTHFEKKRTD